MLYFCCADDCCSYDIKLVLFALCCVHLLNTEAHIMIARLKPVVNPMMKHKYIK